MFRATKTVKIITFGIREAKNKKMSQYLRVYLLVKSGWDLNSCLTNLNVGFL